MHKLRYRVLAGCQGGNGRDLIGLNGEDGAPLLLQGIKQLLLDRGD